MVHLGPLKLDHTRGYKYNADPLVFGGEQLLMNMFRDQLI